MHIFIYDDLIPICLRHQAGGEVHAGAYRSVLAAFRASDNAGKRDAGGDAATIARAGERAQIVQVVLDGGDKFQGPFDIVLESHRRAKEAE